MNEDRIPLKAPTASNIDAATSRYGHLSSLAGHQPIGQALSDWISGKQLNWLDILRYEQFHPDGHWSRWTGGRGAFIDKGVWHVRGPVLCTQAAGEAKVQRLFYVRGDEYMIVPITSEETGLFESPLCRVGLASIDHPI